MQAKSLVLISIGAVLFGSTVPEVWNKDFAAWTRQDAQQIITDSPWAKERPMPIGGRPGVVYVDPTTGASSAPAASLGNPANNANGPNMSSGAGESASPPERNGQLPTTATPSLTQGPVGAPATQPVLKIIWASALPVRLAVLKLRSGKSEPTPAQIARAEEDSPNYVIAVVGLPAPEAGSDPKALARAAFLSLRGKQPIVAIDSNYRRIGNSDVYFFRFPKNALPLTTESGEVGFKLTVAKIGLSQKFQLFGMKYQGRLAL